MSIASPSSTGPSQSTGPGWSSVQVKSARTTWPTPNTAPWAGLVMAMAGAVRSSTSTETGSAATGPATWAVVTLAVLVHVPRASGVCVQSIVSWPPTGMVAMTASSSHSGASGALMAAPVRGDVARVLDGQVERDRLAEADAVLVGDLMNVSCGVPGSSTATSTVFELCGGRELVGAHRGRSRPGPEVVGVDGGVLAVDDDRGPHRQVGEGLGAPGHADLRPRDQHVPVVVDGGVEVDAVADGDHRLVRGQGDLDAGVRRLRAAGVEADVVDEPAVVGPPNLVLAHAEAEADGLPGEGEQVGPAGDVPAAGPDEGRLGRPGDSRRRRRGRRCSRWRRRRRTRGRGWSRSCRCSSSTRRRPRPGSPPRSSRTRRRGGSGGTAVLPAGRATLWVMCTRRSDVAPEVGPVQAVRRRWWRTRRRPRTGRTSGRTRSGRG